MKPIRVFNYLSSGILAFALAVGSLGCSKKAETSNAAETPVTADTNAPATAQDTAPAPDNTPPPVAINTVNVSDAKAAMDAANAAMKAKQYEETAKLLLAIQAQQLNAQQAERARAQMVQFQGALANAIANGDASAQAAAEALRAHASGAGR